jgi:peptide/nickel transport system substrate-binding protein
MMGKSRRRLSMVGLALVATLVAAACGGGNNNGGSSNGASTTPQRGGVYRTATTDFGFTNGFDITGEYLGSAWDLYGATTRTLVGTKHIAGTEGNKLYPDLATETPTPTDNGLTYTFKLKSGAKFGPPVSRAITSKDIAYAFQRINAAPLVAQYGFYYYGIVKGMDGKAKSADQKISGIETPDDQTIVFHLTKATGDFLYRLAMPATGPIPEEVAKCSTKAGDYGRYLISSGPYMVQGSDKLDASSCKAQKPISGFDPTKKLYLVRNPDYDQATDNLRSNYVDGITLDVDTNQDDIFNKIEAGTLDGNFTDVPPKTVLQRYTTDPNKKKYLHANDGDRTWYITMNWATPPFDDIHVRKAANLIMDKAALVQAWGGATSGVAATHVAPPTVLNNTLGQDYDPYATPDFKGDEAKAKDEMKQSKYDSNKDGVCDTPQCKNLIMINRNVKPWTDSEPIVQSSLAKIGIEVKPRELASSAAYTTIQTVKNAIPIALNAGWGKDYADPYTFFGILFASSGIIATGNTNYPLVGLSKAQGEKFGLKNVPDNIPNVDADIDTCQAIPVTEADNRTACWANLDKKLMETAVPWVPYLWNKVLTLVGPSVTKFEFDQFSTQVSFTQLAVNNKATI